MPRPELPPRVYKKDRKFQNGLFVAANVKLAEDGTALFGQVDSQKVEWLQENRRCQMCGQKIAKNDWCVFPGQHGLPKYQEAPLHTECANYSARVCPRIQKVKSNFGFAVCKRYYVVKFEPPYWHDAGCVPTWEGLSDRDKFALSIFHDIRINDKGESYCASCPEWENNSMGHMAFDEFMKWSAY